MLGAQWTAPGKRIGICFFLEGPTITFFRPCQTPPRACEGSAFEGPAVRMHIRSHSSALGPRARMRITSREARLTKHAAAWSRPQRRQAPFRRTRLAVAPPTAETGLAMAAVGHAYGLRRTGMRVHRDVLMVAQIDTVGALVAIRRYDSSPAFRRWWWVEHVVNSRARPVPPSRLSPGSVAEIVVLLPGRRRLRR